MPEFVDVIKPEKKPKQGLFEKDEKYWGRVAGWKKREAARKEGKRIAKPGQVLIGGGMRAAKPTTHTTFAKPAPAQKKPVAATSPTKKYKKLAPLKDQPSAPSNKLGGGSAIGNKSLTEPQKGTKHK